MRTESVGRNLRDGDSLERSSISMIINGLVLAMNSRCHVYIPEYECKYLPFSSETISWGCVHNLKGILFHRWSNWSRHFLIWLQCCGRCLYWGMQGWKNEKHRRFILDRLTNIQKSRNLGSVCRTIEAVNDSFGTGDLKCSSNRMWGHESYRYISLAWGEKVSMF